MRRAYTIVTLLIALTYTMVDAHIDKTSLSIKGGEVFKAGDKVVITWKVGVYHGKPHFIYFSPATGKPWQKLDSIPEKNGVVDMSYIWTVPQSPSTTARIRVFQSFVPSPGEQTNDYTIVSNPFTITTATTGVIADSRTETRLHNSRTTGRILSGASFDLNGRLLSRTIGSKTATREHATLRAVQQR